MCQLANQAEAAGAVAALAHSKSSSVHLRPVCTRGGDLMLLVYQQICLCHYVMAMKQGHNSSYENKRVCG